MKILLPKSLITLSNLLNPLYVTGGYVRNSLLSVPVSDIDVCSSLSVEEVQERLFGTQFVCDRVYKRTGTLLIVDKDNHEKFEYARFRTERYDKGHTPSEVVFTDSLLEDAKRRDFKINALYYDIQSEKLVDPLNGLSDLQKKIVSTVIEPEKVFASDGLRLMRLVRFCAQLGFSTDKQSFEAAKTMREKLSEISKERITEEFLKILTADTAYPTLTAGGFPHYDGIKMLIDLGLMEFIIPELLRGAGLAQRADFHKYDVLEHTLQTLKASRPSIRLAALLHDIAKPKQFFETGKFSGHDREGGKLALKICQEDLKLPRAESLETAKLVELHMADLEGKTSEKKLRWFVAKNIAVMDKLLLLKHADYLGSGRQTEKRENVPRLKAVWDKMKEENAPFTLSQLDINGSDVLTAYPEVQKNLLGQALEALHKRVVSESLLNQKENLLRVFKEVYHNLEAN